MHSNHDAMAISRPDLMRCLTADALAALQERPSAALAVAAYTVLCTLVPS